jgi:predicted nucleotidyltransferase
MKTLEEIESRLTELFSRYFQKDVIAVVLFGSVPRNRVHDESDIDVAVFIKPSIGREQRKQLVFEIYERIPYYFIEPVDVVSLNDADLFLCKEILSKGKMVLRRDESGWKQFRDARLIQWMDYRRSLQNYYPQIA